MGASTRIKSAVKPLARRPGVRRARRRLSILRQYHRLRPSRILIAGTGRAMHVDPADTRGWRLVTGAGRGPQPHLIDLWTDLVDRLAPATVIDVGVNYGEFLLPPRYPPPTRVIGIEANRRLATWLDRSVAEHPDRERIELHYALASDERSESTDFWIDPEWSGRSTAAVGSSSTDGLVHDTPPSLRIDDLFDTPPTGGLLFKIDTEGWEAQVLSGMTATLTATDWAVGMIEFDTRHLERAGDDPAHVLDELVKRFAVAVIEPGGTLPGVDPDDPWSSLRRLAAEDDLVSVDLLLTSDEAMLASMPTRR